jgi:Spy/CpxP family protein refolding chaperone
VAGKSLEQRMADTETRIRQLEAQKRLLAQQAKVQARKDRTKQLIQIGSQIKMNMIDVQNAVMREEMDMQAAEAKIREIGKLKGDMFMAMIQSMHDMRQILTPDQRKKVKEMVMSWCKKGPMPGMGMEEGEETEPGEMQEE